MDTTRDPGPFQYVILYNEPEEWVDEDDPYYEEWCAKNLIAFIDFREVDDGY